jgi:twitching motility protein PilT
MNVVELLLLARSRKASDLHLVSGRPPVLRIHGSLTPLDDFPSLTAADLEEALHQVTSVEDWDYFLDSRELDFSYTIPEILRTRCSAAFQRKTISLSMRLIPMTIPGFEDLHLPAVCKHLIIRPRGLVIISGPTGSGKSTTLAAMIDHLNQTRCSHVVTIEDPIEYVYSDKKSIVIQREIGDDTSSFAEALKHVLRHDPDVVLVGEMRDAETAAATLTLAETGHLVLTTGHAPGASETVERMIDLFPPHERYLAQTRLASLLIGILCQSLIPMTPFEGRVPAVEVMLANSAVRNLIREGKIYQLDNVIRNNSQDGMQLFDHSLVDLYMRKLINMENLFAFCNDRTEVDRLCGGVLVK